MHNLNTFVLMPYGSNGEYGGGVAESNYVFSEIIEPGVREACKFLSQPSTDRTSVEWHPIITREVDRNQSGSITSAIVRSLAQADIVIVDITGRNPNVFFELGIRYAIRSKVTILLAQVGTQLPFDIKVYRCIEYDRFEPAEARTRIAQCICQGLSDSMKCDSLVFEVLPSMSVTIPSIAESHGVEAEARQEIMSWSEYMNRIEGMCVYLEGAMREFRFLPDAVIGITNGGMVAADLIGKRVYPGLNTPVLSLWARRHVAEGASAFWYFDNPFNDAMIGAINAVSEKQHPGRKITLLVVDDHMGTGSTAVQAVAYLKDRLGDQVRIMFLPIVSRRPENLGVVEELLPYNYKDRENKPAFAITKEEFTTQLNTKALYFPYLKKQISVSSGG